MKSNSIPFLFILLSVFTLQTYGQKEISGKSDLKKKIFQPLYERGIPPKLEMKVSFSDMNSNGILELNEKAEIKLTVTNTGKGKAQGIEIRVKDDFKDQGVSFLGDKKINFIFPGRSVSIKIPIEANNKISTAKHTLEISVKEHFGFECKSAYIVMNTLGVKHPIYHIAGIEMEEDPSSIVDNDGKLQAGEVAQVKVFLQNIGTLKSENARYSVRSDDDNIFIKNGEGKVSDIKIGDMGSFTFTICPNQRVVTADDLPVFLTIKNSCEFGEFSNVQLPIKLNKKNVESDVLVVESDINRLKSQIQKKQIVSNRLRSNLGELVDISVVNATGRTLKNSVAIVIGIENYKNLPPAPYAAKDADIVEEYFKKRLGVEQVVTYTNQEMNGLMFDDIFNPEYGELQKAILKGKTDLFVFYSGHGVPSKSGKNVYLFPSDGKIARLKIQGYDLNEFYKNLDLLGAKSVTVFLDACFSGGSRTTEKIRTENMVAMKGVRIRPKIVMPWVKNKTFTVFTSSTGDQTSLGYDNSGTGLFTYYMCVGLNGKADFNGDNKITTGELREFVTQHVTETSVKISGLQTPLFNGDENKVLVEF